MEEVGRLTSSTRAVCASYGVDSTTKIGPAMYKVRTWIGSVPPAVAGRSACIQGSELCTDPPATAGGTDICLHGVLVNPLPKRKFFGYFQTLWLIYVRYLRLPRSPKAPPPRFGESLFTLNTGILAGKGRLSHEKP